MHTSSNTIPAAGLLAVATLAALGLLVLVALDHGSVLAWASVPLPLVLGVGAGHHALKAAGRGEAQSASALVGLGVMANTVVACLAGLAG